MADARSSLQVFAAGVVVAIVLLVVVVKVRKSLLLLLCAAAVMGCSVAGAEAASLHAQTSQAGEAKSERLLVRLAEDSMPGNRGSQALVICEGNTLSGSCMASFEGEQDYLCGQVLEVTGRVSAADFGANSYLWDRGAAFRIAVQGARPQDDPTLIGALVTLRSRALAFLSGAGTHAPVLQALVCGYRADLRQTEQMADYQTCGVAHMVAVSGAHLVIVTGLISALLRLLQMPRRPSIALLVVAMASYVAFSGVPVSAVRAAIMSSVGILSLFGKRRPSALAALGIGVYLIVGTCPHAALSASLALSALSTAGIVLFCPLASRLLEEALHVHVRAVREPLALTLSAGVLAQPYSCALFCMLPLASPLANVACAPLLPICCATGLAAAIMDAVCLPGAGLVLAVAHAATALLDGLVACMAALPHAAVPISFETGSAFAVSGFLAALIWLLWDHVLDVRLLAFALSCCVVAAAIVVLIPRADAVVMLDVGQGDAFLIQSEGRSLLIDTGNHDSQLLDQLARCGVLSLDAVLITHADDDHYGSLDALARCVRVSEVLVANDMLESDDESCREVVKLAGALAPKVEGLACGDVFTVGKFRVRIVWPERFEDDGGNADSVVALVDYDADADGRSDVRSLFTGDAEIDQMQALIEGGAVGEVDLLKVGHHGSRNAMTLEQAEILSPAIALIGVGENNRYGHPTFETLSILEAVGATTLRSDRDGGMRLEMRGDGVKICRL